MSKCSKPHSSPRVTEELAATFYKHWIPVKMLRSGTHGGLRLCIPREQLDRTHTWTLYAVKLAHVGEPLKGHTSLAWERDIMRNMLSEPECPSDCISELGNTDTELFPSWLALRYIRGVSLEQLQDHFRKTAKTHFPGSFAYYVLQEIWHILRFTHSFNDAGKEAVAHGDMTPGNLMFDIGDATSTELQTNFPPLRLIDFGNARCINSVTYHSPANQQKSKADILLALHGDCSDSVSLFHGIAHGEHGPDNNAPRRQDNGRCKTPCQKKRIDPKAMKLNHFSDNDRTWLKLLNETRYPGLEAEQIKVQDMIDKYGSWAQKGYDALFSKAAVGEIWKACIQLAPEPLTNKAIRDAIAAYREENNLPAPIISSAAAKQSSPSLKAKETRVKKKRKAKSKHRRAR